MLQNEEMHEEGMNDLGFLLKKITDSIQIRADSSLAEHGLTLAQLRACAAVYRCGGACSMARIAETLKVSHTTVNGIVDRLQKSGCVRLVPDPEDRRCRRVEFTEKMNDLSELILRSKQLQEERLTAGMSEREKKELFRLLKKIDRNLSEES